MGERIGEWRERIFPPLLLGVLLILRCRLGCPVYRIWGIPCPGCGLTRAWMAFLEGRWGEALQRHGLFLVAPGFVALYAGRDFLSERAGRAADAALYTVGFLLLALRLMTKRI